MCRKIVFKKNVKIIFSFLVCLLAIYSFKQTGLDGIIVSRVQATSAFYAGSNSAIKLIVESIIPAFIAYIVIEAAQSWRNKKEKCIRFWILFICLLVCFFPTTIPRYKMATIYGALLLVLFPKLKKGKTFFWIFTLALFIVFPLLSGFRNVIAWESIVDVFSDGFLMSYTEGDYDAYRMLVSAIRFNKTEGIAWGYQLLGVLLFFVPKSMWSLKPIGSGAMLIRSEFGNNVFSNVSCPLIAEGYVNFGLAGVMLFALILGYIIAKFDKAYICNINENKVAYFSPYVFLVFLTFFILRGDLLSGFAYACGFVVVGICLLFFQKRGY